MRNSGSVPRRAAQPGLGGVGFLLCFRIIEVELNAVERLCRRIGIPANAGSPVGSAPARAMTAFLISSEICRSMRPY